MKKAAGSSGTVNGQFFCNLIHRDPITNVIFGGTSIANALSAALAAVESLPVPSPCPPDDIQTAG